MTLQASTTGQTFCDCVHGSRVGCFRLRRTVKGSRACCNDDPQTWCFLWKHLGTADCLLLAVRSMFTQMSSMTSTKPRLQVTSVFVALCDPACGCVTSTCLWRRCWKASALVLFCWWRVRWGLEGGVAAETHWAGLLLGWLSVQQSHCRCNASVCCSADGWLGFFCLQNV